MEPLVFLSSSTSHLLRAPTDTKRNQISAYGKIPLFLNSTDGIKQSFAKQLMVV
jgi:hypothetical protein